LEQAIPFERLFDEEYFPKAWLRLQQCRQLALKAVLGTEQTHPGFGEWLSAGYLIGDSIAPSRKLKPFVWRKGGFFRSKRDPESYD
jgi:hypothetical protein